MRIIIEFEERPGAPVQTLTEPGRVVVEEAVEAMDGGPPPESLLQLIGAKDRELAPTSELEDAIDAGPPPQELVEAIERAAVPGVEVAPADADAGPAPT